MKKLLLIAVVTLLILAIPPVIVLATAGGQGKAAGNSCMAQCMGINAEFFDASSELTQTCQQQCGIGTGQGSCLTSGDGCCVPFTDDPDCSGWDGGIGPGTGLEYSKHIEIFTGGTSSDFLASNTDCQNLIEASFSDWRLPTAPEAFADCSLLKTAPTTIVHQFWTSTPGTSGTHKVLRTSDCAVFNTDDGANGISHVCVRP